MRRTARLLVVSGVVFLTGAVLPPEAAAEPRTFPPIVTIAPSGGASGTQIRVSGTCNLGEWTDPSGSAQLDYVNFSDAIPPPLDSEAFTAARDGTFSTTLTNPVGSTDGFPNDLVVSVYCGGEFSRRPFHATDSGATSSPTLFTAPGAGVCGYAFAPGHPPIGCGATIKALDARGAVASTFALAGERHGMTVAVGDVDDDGRVEVVNGSGPANDFAHVSVTSLDGTDRGTIVPYGRFNGQVNVAVGDVTGDGVADIVTGAGSGGGPHVTVHAYDRRGFFHGVAGFMAYDPRFNGGVTVAVADTDGDGRNEIVTGAGPGGGPHVKVFDPVGNEKGGFFAYDPAFGGGVSVAAGDLIADRRAELVTGAGAGGGPHVKVFDAHGNTLNGFYAYGPTFTGGVNVAVGHASNVARRQIVVGPGAGGQTHLRVLEVDGRETSAFYAYRPVASGMHVAVLP